MLSYVVAELGLFKQAKGSCWLLPCVRVLYVQCILYTGSLQSTETIRYTLNGLRNQLHTSNKSILYCIYGF